MVDEDKEEIIKNLNEFESYVNRIKERAKSCNPMIAYSLTGATETSDKLFTKYGKIKKYALDSRFNILIKSFEEYRGEFAAQCTCLKKDKTV